jgi:hypothetical protein
MPDDFPQASFVSLQRLPVGLMSSSLHLRLRPDRGLVHRRREPQRLVGRHAPRWGVDVHGGWVGHVDDPFA